MAAEEKIPEKARESLENVAEIATKLPLVPVYATEAVVDNLVAGGLETTGVSLRQIVELIDANQDQFAAATRAIIESITGHVDGFARDLRGVIRVEE